MDTTNAPDATCFSLSQLETIMAWGAAQPRGFSVRIMTDHEDYPELAELFKHDRMSPLWFLNATQAGTAVITKASGADQELGSVELALARVLELARIIHEKCAIKAKPLISLTTMRMGCLMKFFAMKFLAQVFGGLGRFRAVR